MMPYSTVGCRRTGGRRSQPGSFLFFTTPANLVLIFQSVFKSRRLACSAHTACDDARRRSGVVSKSAMPPKKSSSQQTLLTHFSSLGSFFFQDEIPAWPFFGKPCFGTRQYCSVQQVDCERSAASTILSQRLVLNVQKPVQNVALRASEIRILPQKLRKRRSLPFCTTSGVRPPSVHVVARRE